MRKRLRGEFQLHERAAERGEGEYARLAFLRNAREAVLSLDFLGAPLFFEIGVDEDAVQENLAGGRAVIGLEYERAPDGAVGRDSGGTVAMKVDDDEPDVIFLSAHGPGAELFVFTADERPLVHGGADQAFPKKAHVIVGARRKSSVVEKSVIAARQ